MSPTDEISGADLALILDVVGAYWDGHVNYADLMLRSEGLTRSLASAIVLVGILVEQESECRGLTRDECLGVIRGAVA